MQDKTRILFVGFADSPHLQSWVRLLEGKNFDIRIFAFPVRFWDKYAQLDWPYPTYTLLRPSSPRKASKVRWLLPSIPGLEHYMIRLPGLVRLAEMWLHTIIKRWKPDIIHSLSFNMGAYLTGDALEGIPENSRPRWIISSWGTELSQGKEQDETRSKLITCLEKCDWFIGDCYRDIENAKLLGLPAHKLPWPYPIPGAGGINIDELAHLSQPIEQRKLILVPKAYENQANKTLPVLEALRLCQDEIAGYQVYLTMTSPEVQSYVRMLEPHLQERITCLPQIPKNELLQLLGAARLMIAPSLSDGTPNVMLEAMALSALPVMSPIPSIQEWITSGENGLLAHALYPDQISNALRRALVDDELCRRAAQVNREIILERANRESIRRSVVDFYGSLSV